VLEAGDQGLPIVVAEPASSAAKALMQVAERVREAVHAAAR